ncbi:MAG: 2-C-methyl-D-erythritol 2,4-cyclodiphosphate synthase [Acidimicrobiales bacterium]
MDADSFRIGHGFDVHPFAEESGDPKPLVLAGVLFEGHLGLVGHSDGDLIAHACTDALLGATAQGDIGTLFPDDDPALAGANSVEMLRVTAGRLRQIGWSAVNVDCTIVLDSPKIAPHREAMQRILSEAVDASVTIKGKRTEGLVGLSGGIQCFAVALVRRA